MGQCPSPSSQHAPSQSRRRRQKGRKEVEGLKMVLMSYYQKKSDDRSIKCNNVKFYILLSTDKPRSVLQDNLISFLMIVTVGDIA